MNILSMSGYIPEEISDTIKFNGYEGDRNISHYCGYVSDFIDMVLHDDNIDGAVFPHTCDSSRIIKSYLGETNKFIYQLNVPIRRDRAAIIYFANILKEYKTSLECHYNISIDNIAERNEYINKRNEYLTGLYNNLESIKYSAYLMLIHKMLSTPLFKQLDNLPEIEKQESGKPVFLVGSFLSCSNIAGIIEENGMKVIADNLPESGRLISKNLSFGNAADGDIFEKIAEKTLGGRLSPTQNNFKEIIKTDLDIIKKREIKGVIFAVQKYCEPYDYLYSVYKKALDENNIPSVKISLTDSQNDKNAQLSLESFAQTL